MFAARWLWSASVLLILLSMVTSTVQARVVDADVYALSKRLTLFDASCMGIFSIQFLKKLNRVCDDCHNVFREPNISSKCRSNCYNNSVFLQCMEYIVPYHLQDHHKLAVQMVGK